MRNIKHYKGKPLTPDQLSLRKCLEKCGGCFCVTGSADKTIRIMKGGRNYGYINGTVMRRGGIMGYRSPDDDQGGYRDGCPAGKVTKAEARFRGLYQAKRGWMRDPSDQPRKLNGKHVFYLIITDLDLAKMVCECTPHETSTN